MSLVSLCQSLNPSRGFESHAQPGREADAELIPVTWVVNPEAETLNIIVGNGLLPGLTAVSFVISLCTVLFSKITPVYGSKMVTRNWDFSKLRII